MEIKKSKKEHINDVWVYISNAMSIIGTISLVENLKSWHRLLKITMQWAEGLWPPLLAMLVLISDMFSEIITWYREIFNPVFDFMFGWLYADVPQIFIDLTVMLIFSMIVFMRFSLRRNKKERELKKNCIKLVGEKIRDSEFTKLVLHDDLLLDRKFYHGVDDLLYNWIRFPNSSHLKDRYLKRAETSSILTSNVSKQDIIKLNEMLQPLFEELTISVESIKSRYATVRFYRYIMFWSILSWILLDWNFAH